MANKPSMSTIAPDQHTVHVSSPLGRLRITCAGEQVVAVDVAGGAVRTQAPVNALQKKIVWELAAYFKNASHRVVLPIQPEGTEFQHRVWRALQGIPVGQTLSYGELAKKLRSSPRAVGNACRANPLPVIIPCHRVVAANDIGGYSGETRGRQLDIKRWLLRHEGASV
jgi:methylated-DNA-[protein]-cysteine S-methyltransferase